MKRLGVLLIICFLTAGLPVWYGTACAEDDGTTGEAGDTTLVFDFPDGVWYGEDIGSRLAHLFCNVSDSGDVVDLDGDGSYDIRYQSGNSEIGYSAYIAHLGESNLSGTYNWSIRFSEDEYSYTEFGPEATVIFHFDEFPSKKEYSVSVEGGYAVNGAGNTVTKLAAGDRLIPVPNAFEGKYVSGWETNFKQGHDAYGDWRMPRKDAVIKAVVKEQTPYTIDLSEGFFTRQSYYDEDSSILSGLEESCRLSSEGYSSGSYDLDGDGTLDITLAKYYDDVNYNFQQFHIIPLSTTNLRGDYTVKGLNTSPYWPITIRFPEKAPDSVYFLTINGGYAENANGETVEQAAPGTPLRLYPDDGEKWFNKVEDNEYYGYGSNLVSYYWAGFPQMNYANFVMPACDLSLTIKKGFDDTPTVTPTPTVIPTPTETVPTPTEAVPTPTEEQKITEAATPTPAGTEKPDGADKEKETVSGDSEKKESNKLWLILIPTAAVLFGAIAAYIMMNKKKPEKPAQEEE